MGLDRAEILNLNRGALALVRCDGSGTRFTICDSPVSHMNTTYIAVFILCFVLALPTPGTTQDAPEAKSAPSATTGTKPIAPKDLLKLLVGSWEGTCTTWLQSDKPADESSIKGEIRPMFDGRLIRHTYEGIMLGKPRHGEETIAWNSIRKRFQVSWVDDFHMRNTILFSEGDASERGFTVKGKWETRPKAPAWGWNTVFELVDEDHLTVTAYVIKPDGQQKKAVETKYTRAKK
jgi:hypothetical protein